MRYAIFLKEINLSIFSFFSYMRNLNSKDSGDRQAIDTESIMYNPLRILRRGLYVNN